MGWTSLSGMAWVWSIAVTGFPHPANAIGD